MKGLGLELRPARLDLYDLLLAAVGVQRLWELGRSRKHLRARALRGATPRSDRTLTVLAAIQVLLLGAPLVEHHLRSRPTPRAVVVPAATALALAQGLRAWVLASLGTGWSVRVLPPERIVTSGPYRYLRHPNYLAVMLEVASLPLAGGAYLSALLLSLANGLALRARIRAEEQVLARKPEWRAHFDALPRLLPKPLPH